VSAKNIIYLITVASSFKLDFAFVVQQIFVSADITQIVGCNICITRRVSRKGIAIGSVRPSVFTHLLTN